MSNGNGNGHSPTWVNVRVKLGDLKPWQLNPRHITKKQALRLQESFDAFGQVETIAVGPDNDVYNGHQRLSILLKLHGPDYEIDARQADRPLTDEERRKLVVYLHASAVGEWDWDMVSSWPADELIRNGFDSDLLGGWRRDIAALGALVASEAASDEFDFSNLPNSDRAPFRQVTFTLHDSQFGQVETAIKASKAMGAFVNSPNENSNGNALARICETFMTEHGNG